MRRSAVALPWLLLAAAALILVIALRSGRRAASLPSAPAAAATTPPAATTSITPLRAFSNPAYPYEIGYPPDWHVAAANPEQVVLSGPAGQQVRIETQPLPADQASLPVSVYADRRIEALRAQLPKLVELQRTPLTLVAKRQAVEADLTWEDAAGKHRALWLFVLDSGVNYSLRADAPFPTFASHRRLLERLLRSFSLTPSD